MRKFFHTPTDKHKKMIYEGVIVSVFFKKRYLKHVGMKIECKLYLSIEF
jgi:hypothetical protein